MSAGERIWVATGFVPFTHRRVDAIADALVHGVVANGFRSERLRIPADVRCAPAVGASAAGAALVDVTWAHRLICLEFPCMQLLHGRAAAWRVRAGLDHDLVAVDDGGLGMDAAEVASSFDRDWAEEGAAGSGASRDVECPAGLLSDHLERRGVVAADGDGMLIISLHPSADAHARVLSASNGDAPVVPPTGEPAAGAAGLEQALWASAGRLPDVGAAAVHIMYPADAPADFVARGPGAAGAFEQWTAVAPDDSGTELVIPAGTGASPADSRAAWVRLARELVP
jgi:hypothetical protein